MRKLFLLPIVAFAACSGAAQIPQTASSSLSNAVDASVANTADAAVDSPAPLDASPDGPLVFDITDASTTDAKDDSKACPVGMKLVEGDYCTEIEQKCLRSWYAKENRKVVCYEFEAPSKCIGPKVHKRYCMDTYEWPNVQGERPEIMNNFYQAQVKCAAVGKRMCSETEWSYACEGPDMKPYPYGYARDPRKCNGEHEWDGPSMRLVAKRDAKELGRLWRGVRSGSQPNCISDFGIADLPGNTDEVAANEDLTDYAKGLYDSVTTGGPWYKGVRNQCRPKIYTHDEGFYYYYLSFRCCSNPDGAANDPRTERQAKRNWQFNRVEGLARFTTTQMKAKLKLKEEGKCSCRETDILCKTMCGTLLGDNAIDADKDTRP